MKPLLILVAGGSASGKTTVASKIYEEFKESNRVLIIRQDDYYKDQTHMEFEQRIKTNYDHPEAFDIKLLNSDLNKLLIGKKILKPVYDFVNHTRKKEKEEVSCSDIILLEGLFALENLEIRNLSKLKIFVDTDEDIRFIRRLQRDMLERGRTMESVVNQYLQTVKPMHNLFIEPTRRFADIIIPSSETNEIAVDLIITKISSIIST